MKSKTLIPIAMAGFMAAGLTAPIYADPNKSIFELGAAEAKHPQTFHSKGGKL